MKGNTKRIIIALSTIFLVILMIIFVDFRVIMNNILKISLYGIILFIIVYTFSFLFRSIRLKEIFSGINFKTNLIHLFGSYGIGWGINEITPGKIGDLARIEVIHEKESQISLSKSVCAITIERYIDLFILFVITCFIMIYMYSIDVEGFRELNLSFYIGVGALLLIAGIIALVFLLFKTEFLLKIVGKFSDRLKHRLETFLKKFLEGMNDFRKNKEKILSVLLLSIPTWFLDAFTIVILFYLTGFEINFFIIILAQIVSFFTKTFPITPGGWIISENAGALLLLLFYPSLSYTSLLSIFILDHIIRTAYVLIYGITSSFLFNFKFKRFNVDLINKSPVNEETHKV